jgi:2-keto-4-pentenoate hydratase/2-oxohepta-3-ene-1,7-dioic acid hydratase in catechol pathway
MQVVPDPHTLPLRTWVNGELRQQGCTDDFVFDVPKLVAFCSQGNTLQVGSVILTGTCSGVGFAMKPPQYLKSGDKIEMSFGPVGTLVHGIRYE